MKNSIINRYELKKIFDTYINNNQQSNIDGSDQDKINKKINILRMKVLSKHDPLTNEQRKQLKEKRLNTIFDKSNYTNNEMIKYNEISQKDFYSFLISEKANNNFLEKYKELYDMTINNKNRNFNNIKKDNINYYLNNLKSYNDKNFSYDMSMKNIFLHKVISKSQGKNQLKRKYNNLNNEIFDNLYNETSKNDIFNSSMYSLRTNINKNIILNNLLNTKNSKYINIVDVLMSNSNNKNNKKIKFFSDTFNNHSGSSRVISSPKIIYFSENNNNDLIQYQLLKKIDKLNNNINYLDYIKSNRPKSSSRIYTKKHNYNNLYKNIPFNTIKRSSAKNNINNILYDQQKERIDYKLNHFKARLNLLSLK